MLVNFHIKVLYSRLKMPHERMELRISVIGHITTNDRVGRSRRVSDLVIVNSRTPNNTTLLNLARNYFRNNRAEGRILIFNTQANTIIKTLL